MAQRFSHKCDLGQEFRNDFSISPFSSTLQKIWYRLREDSTVYWNPETSQHFRSNAAFFKEKTRHLSTKEYRYIIHPFSLFQRRKRMVMLVAWFVIFLVDPYLGSFLAPTYLNPTATRSVVLDTTLLIYNCGLALDVLLRFFIGYVVKQTREIVLNPGTVVKQYLQFYFFVDAIPIAVGTIMNSFDEAMGLKYQILIFQLKYIRMFRLNTMISNFQLVMQMLNLGDTACVFGTIALVAILLIHWWTCFLAVVPVILQIYDAQSNDSWLLQLEEQRTKMQLSVTVYSSHNYSAASTYIEDYIEHAQAVICHFFGAGTGKYTTTDAFEMLVLSLILLSGLTFCIICLAKVLQLFGTVNISETKFEQLIAQAKDYMTTRRFPRKLRNRVWIYYDVKFCKKFFSERQILNTLSEHLRMEVLLYSCQNMVEHVQIFQGLSKSAIGSMLALLKHEIYLPKDVVMWNERDKGKLYFVLFGTCMLQVMPQKEACHIEDGAHFGEIDLLEEQTHMRFIYKVVAIEPAQIYSLQENDLQFCCKNYPEIRDKMEGLASTRLDFYRHIMTAVGDDVEEEDIMGQLAQGKILRHGIRRDLF